MQLKKDVPVHLQIKSLINYRIVTKQYLLGSCIPTDRELTAELKININLVRKALDELLQEKVLIFQSDVGNCVTEDLEIVKKLEKEFIVQIIQQMNADLSHLGLSETQILEQIKLYYGES